MRRLNAFGTKDKTERISLQDYLQRLGLAKEEPSLSYLNKLQKAHLQQIPFENLDIHYRNEIELDYKKVFNKVVVNRRGGFCYELNGLFYHLLYHLGFPCFIVQAQVWDGDKEVYGRPFDHMAILVHVEGDLWLVDVGFGDGIISPIRVKPGHTQMDYTKYWRIDTDPDGNLLLRKSRDTAYFQTVYRFIPEEVQLIQFLEMCHYHQTSPESSFTQQKLITQLTSDGRVTLTNRSLKVLNRGQEVEEPIHNEDEFLAKLQYHFGIKRHQLLSHGA